MKRFLMFFYGITTVAIAMDNQQPLRPIEAIKPIIISLLTQEKPLSEEDIRQAKKLIKEIRAQSPAQGFQYSDKLNSRKSDDSIQADPLLTHRIHLSITPPPTQSVSPLAI